MAILKPAEGPHTMTIASVEEADGKFGAQWKFTADNGDLMFLSEMAAARQIARLGLTMESCVGQTLVFTQTQKLDPCLGRLAFEEATSAECGPRLAAFLMTVDLTGYSPTESFHTEAKERLIEYGFSPADHYWHDCWRTGTFTVDEVYADFLAYCNEHGFSAKTMERWSKIGFSRHIPPQVVRGQRSTANDRARTLTLPPLPNGQPDPTPPHRLRRNPSVLSPLPRRPTPGY